MSEKLGDTLVSVSNSAPARNEELSIPSTRFEVGDELGRGGMGRVVAAKDRSLGREVAIKHALSSQPEDIARFEREVRITALLEHPAIVPIHETGSDEHGQPYYVMRRIEGKPLTERIENAPDTQTRLALIPRLLPAVDAAAFAHARGIIHRDIKPSNILLGSYGETLLIDWGLARSLTENDPDTRTSRGADSDLTQAGSIVGTPGYMSPEQARGESLDARADVFALGATLYHVLSGKAPFAGRRVEERIALAVLGEQPARDVFDSDVPVELIAIIDKALAPVLDQRYRDAGELARDLHAFLGGKLVGAHRYTARERVGRFIRRHRIAVAIAAIATVAVIAVGVIAIVNVVRERDLATSAHLDAVEQRRLADERADEMLLDQASAIASADPTRAVLLLRRLPESSKQGKRARDIAAVAATSGISIGSTLHEGLVLSLEISPDGRQLLSSGDDGRIAIHDLARGGGRVIARLSKRVPITAWTEAGTSITAVTAEHTLIVIDPITGTIRRVLDPVATVRHLWTIDNGERIRYLEDGTKQLREIGPQGGPPRVLVDQAQAVGSDGDHTIVVGVDRVTLLEGAERRELRIAYDRVVQVVVDRTHRRFAILLPQYVEERTYDGQLIARHEVKMRPFRGGYAGDRLYVANGEGVTLSLRATEMREVMRSEAGVSWAGRTKSGTAFAFADGSLSLIDRVGVHRVTMDHQVRVLATSRSSMVVATGSNTGEITWKDLSRVHPVPIQSDALQPCHVERDRLYLLQDTRLLEIDRVTDARRMIYESDRPISRCLGRVGDSMLIQTYDDSILLRLADGKPTPLGTLLVTMGAPHTAVVARGREVIELDERTGTERLRWTAPAPIAFIAASKQGVLLTAGTLVVLLADAGVTQFELPNPPTALGVMANGEIWYAIGDTVYARGTAGTRALFRFPQPVFLWQQEGGEQVGIMLADRSAWQLTERGGENRLRSVFGRQTSFGPGYVVVQTNQTTSQFIHLGSGEKIVRDHARTITRFRAMEDGTLVMVLDFSNFVIYEPVVPRDLAAYRSWLANVTNATLEAGVLVWR
jgi:hypothetical protein